MPDLLPVANLALEGQHLAVRADKIRNARRRAYAASVSVFGRCPLAPTSPALAVTTDWLLSIAQPNSLTRPTLTPLLPSRSTRLQPSVNFVAAS